MLKERETQIQEIYDDINKNKRYKELICLNQKQTSGILGVSQSSLENWRKDSVGPDFIKVNVGRKGRILYSKASIANWVINTTKTI